MDTLNDDCQLNIIKYLYLAEQLALFEATEKEPTNRWVSNLRYTWQHQRIFSLNWKEFEHFDKNPQLLRHFLSSISPTVHKLGLYDLTSDRLECWTGYNFPKMRIFEYSLKFGEDDKEANLVIQLMIELFPELTHFKPDGKFDINYLTNWMNLRKLDMRRYCPVDQNDQFGKDMGGLQMLEDLVIFHEDLTEEQFKMFMRLPKLQRLNIQLLEHICLSQVIKMLRAKDIEKITLNCDSLGELFDVKQLINLRELTLWNLDEEMITREDFLKIITALPVLERINFMYTRFWCSEIELWETVANCPSLKILNISVMDIDEDFFLSDRRPMEKALNKRSSPLILYSRNSGEIERLMCLYFKHPKLKVSFEPLEFQSCGLFQIQLHFYPLAMATTLCC